MRRIAWLSLIALAAVVAITSLPNRKVHAQTSTGTVNLGQNGFTCVVAVSTATTIQAVGGSCVAPTNTALRLYITDVEFGSSAAGGTAADSFPTLKTGTGGTCGTGTAVVWQAMITANGQIEATFTTPIQLPKASELCWIMTTAGSKTLQVHGFMAQ